MSLQNSLVATRVITFLLILSSFGIAASHARTHTQKSVSTLQDQFNQLTQRLMATESLIANLKNQQDLIQGQIVQIQSEMGQSITPLNQHLKDVESVIRTLEGRPDITPDQAKTLKPINEAKADLNRLIERIIHTQGDIPKSEPTMGGAQLTMGGQYFTIFVVLVGLAGLVVAIRIARSRTISLLEGRIADKEAHMATLQGQLIVAERRAERAEQRFMDELARLAAHNLPPVDGVHLPPAAQAIRPDLEQEESPPQLPELPDSACGTSDSGPHKRLAEVLAIIRAELEPIPSEPHPAPDSPPEPTVDEVVVIRRERDGEGDGSGSERLSGPKPPYAVA